MTQNEDSQKEIKPKKINSIKLIKIAFFMGYFAFGYLTGVSLYYGNLNKVLETLLWILVWFIIHLFYTPYLDDLESRLESIERMKY